MRFVRLCPLVVCLALPVEVGAQALPNVNLTRVLYNTRKTTVHPEGELKAQIDAVDVAIAEATKLGQTGEVRRQLAKGLTLLEGRAWTPALDYQASLVLRSERTVIDSSRPYVVRLEQIYRPATALSPALSAVVRLKKRTPGMAGPPAAAASWTVVRELGRFDGVSRDLRESAFAIDLALDGVADDTYAVEAEVQDAGTPVGTPFSLHDALPIPGLSTQIAAEFAAERPGPLSASELTS